MKPASTPTQTKSKKRRQLKRIKIRFDESETSEPKQKRAGTKEPKVELERFTPATKRSWSEMSKETPGTFGIQKRKLDQKPFLFSTPFVAEGETAPSDTQLRAQQKAKREQMRTLPEKRAEADYIYGYEIPDSQYLPDKEVLAKAKDIKGTEMEKTILRYAKRKKEEKKKKYYRERDLFSSTWQTIKPTTPWRPFGYTLVDWGDSTFPQTKEERGRARLFWGIGIGLFIIIVIVIIITVSIVYGIRNARKKTVPTPQHIKWVSFTKDPTTGCGLTYGWKWDPDENNTFDVQILNEQNVRLVDKIQTTESFAIIPDAMLGKMFALKIRTVTKDNRTSEWEVRRRKVVAQDKSKPIINCINYVVLDGCQDYVVMNLEDFVSMQGTYTFSLQSFEDSSYIRNTNGLIYKNQPMIVDKKNLEYRSYPINTDLLVLDKKSLYIQIAGGNERGEDEKISLSII